MPINFEGEMFEPVKNFLQTDFICSGPIGLFMYDAHKGIPKGTGWKLVLNNYCSHPDVYGIRGGKIYLCQGKLINKKEVSNNKKEKGKEKRKGKLWELVGQGISNRNYCDYVYIFFEKKKWEEIKKVDEHRKDFIDILKHCNMGLLVVNDDLKVDMIIKASKQNAPEGIKNNVKQKIEMIIYEDEFLKDLKNNIMSTIKPKPRLFKVYRRPLNLHQPAYYIYLEEWQEQKNLSYFIKFLKEKKVRVGINVSQELMQEEFLNRLLTKPRFAEYNDKNIEDRLDFKKSSVGTHEFHDSVPLGQSAEEFFNDIKSEKNQNITENIKEKFLEIVRKMDLEYLKTLIKDY